MMTLCRAGVPVSRRSFLAESAAFAATSALSSASITAIPQEAPVSPTLRAQKLAWAGVRLQLEKATLFLDPLINPDVWGSALKDRLIPADPVEGDRFVLVTHRHPDHFDPQTVRNALGDSGILACDADVAPLAAAAGFKVRVAPHYEPILLGDFTATAVPAVDGYGDPQVSWVVSGGGRRIIHCGDTLWHGAWWRIGRQLGPFDAAFLPINGASP
jgi:L-ascorbate metabolism protein UlaG (beta-lactamase superfamily)